MKILDEKLKYRTVRNVALQVQKTLKIKINILKNKN